MDKPQKERADLYPKLPDDVFETITSDLYVYCNSDDHYTYYMSTKDPMRVSDRSRYETDINQVVNRLIERLGNPGISNPIVLRIGAVKYNRAESFNIATPSMIRRGANKHFEDLNGNIVSIPLDRGENPAFPFVGHVISDDGEEICIREYDGVGRCSDGVEDHRLVVLGGKDEIAVRKKLGEL